MKLYVTWTSPYARVVRIALIEKGLESRCEVLEAQTRTPASPYYAINPSGRVPYLERDDGPGLEDSGLIVAYLDSVAPRPRLLPELPADNWGFGRLEAYARSMTDGLSVWVREMRRPEDERSPTILAHEAARAERLADMWEGQVGHAVMQGPLNTAQLYLLAGLDAFAYARLGDLTKGRPKLATWARRLRERPSVVATAPAPRSPD